MKYSVVAHQQIVFLSLFGRFDASAEENFLKAQSRVLELLKEHNLCLVIDIHEVTLMDDSAINMLMSLREKISELCERKITLVNPNSTVAKFLETSGIKKSFNVA